MNQKKKKKNKFNKKRNKKRNSNDNGNQFLQSESIFSVVFFSVIRRMRTKKSFYFHNEIIHSLSHFATFHFDSFHPKTNNRTFPVIVSLFSVIPSDRWFYFLWFRHLVYTLMHISLDWRMDNRVDNVCLQFMVSA